MKNNKWLKKGSCSPASRFDWTDRSLKTITWPCPFVFGGARATASEVSAVQWRHSGLMQTTFYSAILRIWLGMHRFRDHLRTVRRSPCDNKRWEIESVIIWGTQNKQLKRTDPSKDCSFSPSLSPRRPVSLLD